VVAVDPAEASLEVAGLKDGAAEVRWIHGDAAALPSLGADLAVMTGNVAQVFLTDEDWERALGGIGAALRPGGYLVFETRRPEYRAWQEWAADTGPVTLDVPGIGAVEQRRAVTQVNLPFVSFRHRDLGLDAAFPWSRADRVQPGRLRIPRTGGARRTRQARTGVRVHRRAPDLTFRTVNHSPQGTDNFAGTERHSPARAAS
jgi:SAM-dependent methyltransferase